LPVLSFPSSPLLYARPKAFGDLWVSKDPIREQGEGQITEQGH